jgi:hypothetical protein
MYLRLAFNLLHFLSDFGALYALHSAPNFYEIHPMSQMTLKVTNEHNTSFDVLNF